MVMNMEKKRTEMLVVDKLSRYKKIVARMKLLQRYSVGNGITVGAIRQDDHLQELHAKLRNMPTYMYLSKREQELETTAHAYLTSYPAGTKAQLNAVPTQGADAEDDRKLRELRSKIEKVIEARSGVRQGYGEVIDRISELQDLEREKDEIETTLEALEEYKPEYAKLLRCRFLEGCSVEAAAMKLHISRTTYYDWYQKAIEEYADLAL